MTYKKYIKRNGKLYGPYLYESKRVNGKVISEYIGQGKKKQKRKTKNLPYFLIPIVLGIALFILFSSSGPFTGKAILSLKTINSSNTYNGNITLNLLKGELLPANSIIKIKNSNKSYILQLNQILNENTTNGTYYSNQIHLSGAGEGYGKMGTKLIPETVFFKIKLIPQNQTQINSTISPKTNTSNTSTNQTNITQNYSSNNSNSNSNSTSKISSTNQTQINSTISPKTNTSNTSTNQTNITQNYSSNNSNSNSNSTSKISSTTESSNNTAPPIASTSNLTTVDQTTNVSITGNAITSKRNSNNLFNTILGFFSKFLKQTGNAIQNNTIIQANTEINNPYKYNLPSKTTAVLIPGSVSTKTTPLPDNSITLTINSGKLIVTTNYSKVENGFGKDFIENQSVPYTINLNKKNIILAPGKVTISLEAQNKTILTLNQNVENTSINFKNLTQNIFNKTQTNFTKNTLSPKEQKTLENQFGKNFTVLINASKYRNKVIVTFTLGTYSLSNTYSNNLSDKELKIDIKRDKLLWLKDLTNSFSFSPQRTSIKNLSL